MLPKWPKPSLTKEGLGHFLSVSQLLASLRRNVIQARVMTGRCST